MSCTISAWANRPTGPDRAFAVARARLADVADVAHEHGATVNDVVLAAVAGALHNQLRDRGELVDHFVISVPVSDRTTATTTQLGNHVGVIPVQVPATGDPLERLASIAHITGARKTASRAASAALIGPAFRALARLRLLRWVIQHQRLVNTIVTDLRGPPSCASFLGGTITDVIALPALSGN